MGFVEVSIKERKETVASCMRGPDVQAKVEALPT
jgi:hypothetical protein